MKIKAATVTRAGDPLSIVDVQLDEPQANEVLIKIVATGVCHTDAVGRDGGTTPMPVALGHEGAGIVEKVGNSVSTVEPGDHVVLSFAYCGNCSNCLTGHPGMCTHFNELNFEGANHDGSHRLHLDNGEDVSVFFGQSSFADHVVADEHNVVKVDSEVDLRLLGPLGCGIQTGAGTVLNYIHPKFGDSIVVFGTGAVGLSAIMAAKIAGVAHIIAIDIFDNRLALAKKLGATEVINSKVIDPDQRVREIVPQGVDYSIDTTGVSPVIKTAIHVLKPAGECVLLGVGGDLTLNVMGDLLAESKKLSGVVEGDAVPQLFIPQLVDYYKRGLFPFDKLIKFYDFDQINQAFADSKSGQVLKPVVTL